MLLEISKRRASLTSSSEMENMNRRGDGLVLLMVFFFFESYKLLMVQRTKDLPLGWSGRWKYFFIREWILCRSMSSTSMATLGSDWVGPRSTFHVVSGVFTFLCSLISDSEISIWPWLIGSKFSGLEWAGNWSGECKEKGPAMGKGKVLLWERVFR